MATLGGGGPDVELTVNLSAASIQSLIQGIARSLTEGVNAAQAGVSAAVKDLGKKTAREITVVDDAIIGGVKSWGKFEKAGHEALSANQKDTINFVGELRKTTKVFQEIVAQINSTAALERQDRIKRNQAAAEGARKEVELIRNIGRNQFVEGQRGVVVARGAAKSRVLITQAMARSIILIEKGIGATLSGVARTSVGALRGVFSGVAGLLRRDGQEISRLTKINNREFTEGLQSSLSKRESILRSSFRNQETVISRSVLRQQERLAVLRKSTSTGVLGAVTGRGIGGGLGQLVGGFSVAAALVSTFRVGSQFVQGLAVLQEQLQLTDDQMQGVRALSIQLGNDIKLPGVSALDAAEAIQILTKTFGSLGPGALDAAKDAAKGTLELARAAGVGAEDAASVIGAAINVFKIDAKDAVEVADSVAVALAKGAGVSFEDFKTSFIQGAAVFQQFIGPTAKAKDVLVDFNTAIAVLAKSGQVGEVAGAGLKQFFLQGTKQGLKSVEVTDELVKRAGATGKIFFDAEGKARRLDDALDILRRGLIGYSDEQRNAALSALFGSRSIVTANALLSASAVDWDNLRGSMERQGAAADIAAAANTGLKGALDALKSVVETVQIVLYEKIQKPIGAVVLSLATLVNTILFSNGAWAIFRRAALGAAAGIASIIALKGAVEILKLLGTVLTALTTPFGAVLAVAALVGAAIALMTDHTLALGQALRDLTDPLREGFGKLIGAKPKPGEAPGTEGHATRPRDVTWADNFVRLKEILTKDVVPAVQSAAKWVGEHLVAGLRALWGFIETKVIPVFKVFYHFIVDTLVPTIVRFTQTAIRDLIGAFRATVRFVEDRLIPAFKTGFAFLLDFGKRVGRVFVAIEEAVVRFWDRVSPVLQPAIDGFKALASAIGAAFTGDFSKLGEGVSSVGSGLLGTLGNIGGIAVDALGKAWEMIRAFMARTFAVKNLLKFADGFADLAERIGFILGNLVSNPKFIAALAGVALAAAAIAGRFLIGFANGVLKNLPNVLEVLAKAIAIGLFLALKAALGNLQLTALVLAIFGARSLIRGFTAMGSASGGGFLTGLRSSLRGAGQSFSAALRGPVTTVATSIAKRTAADTLAARNRLRILGGTASTIANPSLALLADRRQADKLAGALTEAQIRGLQFRDTLRQSFSAVGAIGGGIKGIGVAAGVLVSNLARIPAQVRNPAAFAVNTSGVATQVRKIAPADNFLPRVPVVPPPDTSGFLKKFQALGPAVAKAMGSVRTSARNALFGLAVLADTSGITKKFQDVALGAKQALGAVRTTARKALFNLAVLADTSGITKKFQAVALGAKQALSTVRTTARKSLIGLAAFVDSAGITKKFQAIPGSARAAFDKVKAASKGIGAAFGATFSGIGKAWQATTGGISRTASGAFTKLGTTLNALSTSVGQSAAGKLGKAIAEGVGTGVRAAGSSLRTSIVTMVDGVKQAAANAATTVGRAIGSALKNAAIAGASAIGGFVAGQAEGSSGGSGLVSALLGGFATAALIGGPAGVAVGAVTAGAALIGASFGRAKKKTEEFKAAVDELSRGFTTTFKKAIDDGVLSLGDLQAGLSFNVAIRVGDNEQSIVDKFAAGLTPEQRKRIDDTGITIQTVFDILSQSTVDGKADLDAFNTKFQKVFLDAQVKSGDFTHQFGQDAAEVRGILQDILKPADGIATISDFLTGKILDDPTALAGLDKRQKHLQDIYHLIQTNAPFLDALLKTSDQFTTQAAEIIAGIEDAQITARLTVVIPKPPDLKGFVHDLPPQDFALELKPVINQAALQAESAKAAGALAVLGVPIDDINAKLAAMHLAPLSDEVINNWKTQLGILDTKAQAVTDALAKIPDLFAAAILATATANVTPISGLPSVGATSADAIVATAGVVPAIQEAISKGGVLGGAELTQALATASAAVGPGITEGVRAGLIKTDADVQTFLDGLTQGMIEALGPRPDDPELQANWDKSKAAIDALFANVDVQPIIDDENARLAAQKLLDDVKLFMLQNPLVLEVVAEFNVQHAKEIARDAGHGLTFDKQPTVNFFTQLGLPSHDEFKQEGTAVGGSLITGLAGALHSAESKRIIRAAATDLKVSTLAVINDLFGIRSPSTVFAEVGNFLTQGLADGITTGADAVTATATTMAQNVIDAAQAVLNGGLTLPDVPPATLPQNFAGEPPGTRRVHVPVGHDVTGAEGVPFIPPKPFDPRTVANQIIDLIGERDPAARADSVLKAVGRGLFDSQALNPPIAGSLLAAFTEGSKAIVAAQTSMEAALVEGRRVLQFVRAAVIPVPTPRIQSLIAAPPGTNRSRVPVGHDITGAEGVPFVLPRPFDPRNITQQIIDLIGERDPIVRAGSVVKAVNRGLDPTFIPRGIGAEVAQSGQKGANELDARRQDAFDRAVAAIVAAQAGIAEAIKAGQATKEIVRKTDTPPPPPPPPPKPTLPDVAALARAFGFELARRPEVTNVSITETKDARATGRAVINSLRGERMLLRGRS